MSIPVRWRRASSPSWHAERIRLGGPATRAFLQSSSFRNLHEFGEFQLVTKVGTDAMRKANYQPEISASGVDPVDLDALFGRLAAGPSGLTLAAAGDGR